MIEGGSPNRELKKNAVIKGLILGIIVLVLSVFSYYYITALTKTMWLIIAGPYFFAIVIPIIIIVFFCVNMRKKLGGYWSFKQAVTSIFIMFLVNYAILTIGRDLIFAKLIEPDMVKKTELVMLDVKARSLKMGGAKQGEVDAQITDLKKQFDLQKNISIVSILEDYIINVILLFVVSLVFAAIFKKEKAHAAAF